MRVFFRAISVQVLANIYLFWWGWRLLPERKYIRISYALFFLVEFLIYMTGYLASDHLSPSLLYYTTWIGNSWLIFLIYATTFLLGYDCLRILNRLIKPFREKIDLSSRKIRSRYFCGVIVFVLGLMIYGSYNFRNPVATEMSLYVDKEVPHLKELRVVMISDTHVGALIDKDILSMYVDRVMEQKPDIILIVGDIIDYDLKSVVQQNMQEEFKRLKAPYGVYGSTGNHEYIGLTEEKDYNKVDWLTDKSGITMLRDTAILIDSAFYIVGREDDKCLTRKSLTEVMTNVDHSYPIIVMNHEPHVLQQEVDAGADIALYGHTHDGQIFPWNLVMKKYYEVSHGYVKKENTHIYVSSGLGLAGPQYRIATKSEIVVLNVKFGKE